LNVSIECVDQVRAVEADKAVAQAHPIEIAFQVGRGLTRSRVQRVAAGMKQADRIHHTWKGRIDAAYDPGPGAARQVDTLLCGRTWNAHKRAHLTQPIEEIGTLEARVVGRCSQPRTPGGGVKQARGDDPVGLGPRLGCAAEERRKELTDKALPLLRPPAVVVHHAAIVEEHDEPWHQHYPHDEGWTRASIHLIPLSLIVQYSVYTPPALRPCS
jgi:hypothetical protein